MNNELTVNKAKEEYGEYFNAHLLEQYKVVRSAIVDIQNDRNVNNRFLFTILTSLLAISSFAVQQALTQSPATPNIFLFTMLSPIFGVAISWIWIGLNNTYHEGMRVRYDVLKDIEKCLPACPFTREYERRSNNYVSVSKIAIRIAKVFVFINVIFLLIFAGYFIMFLLNGQI